MKKLKTPKFPKKYRGLEEPYNAWLDLDYEVFQVNNSIENHKKNLIRYKKALKKKY